MGEEREGARAARAFVLWVVSIHSRLTVVVFVGGVLLLTLIVFAIVVIVAGVVILLDVGIVAFVFGIPIIFIGVVVVIVGVILPKKLCRFFHWCTAFIYIFIF